MNRKRRKQGIVAINHHEAPLYAKKNFMSTAKSENLAGSSYSGKIERVSVDMVTE